MIPLRELRKICQPESVKQTDVVLAKIFYRKFSIYFTYLLLQLRVNANLATIIGITFSFLGIVMICFNKDLLLIVGALFLQIGYLFDCIDGEIARYDRIKQGKEIVNLSGDYMDAMGHLLIQPLMIFSLGFGVIYYFPDKSLGIILLAFAGAMGIIGLPNIAVASSIYTKIKKFSGIMSNSNFKKLISEKVSFSEHRYNPDIPPRSFPPLDEILVFPGLMVNVTFICVIEAILRYFNQFLLAGYIRLVPFSVLSIIYIVNLFRTFRRNFLYLNRSL